MECKEIDFIINLGLMRKRNECAKCHKKMDLEEYNIQLCTRCRFMVILPYTVSPTPHLTKQNQRQLHTK